MPHILLVNPWIHDFSAYDLWMKPLGLLYLGAGLEQHGYHVTLIDCLNARARDRAFGCGEITHQVITKPALFSRIPRKYKRYGITPERFLAELTEQTQSPPALILVTSMMTYWYPGVFETIRYLKKAFPKVPIVLGGVYATLCYEHAVKYSGADYVVRGSGEATVLTLADKITGRISAERRTPSAASYPAYHLYPDGGLSYVAMLASRGCPFRCTYCASSLLYNGFDQRAPDEVYTEIEYYLEKMNIRDIAFYDDALLVNPERLIHPLLDLIIKEGVNRRVRFHTPNGLHIRYLTEDIAGKLYRAGFKTIRLGFESNQSRWQTRSSHKVTNEEFRQAVANLRKAGYAAEEIGVYVLVGLPGQTLSEMKESIDFVARMGCRVKIAQYAPIPGTTDFQRAVQEYGLDPAEPLYHNKSIYPFGPPGRSFTEMDNRKIPETNGKYGIYRILPPGVGGGGAKDTFPLS